MTLENLLPVQIQPATRARARASRDRAKIRARLGLGLLSACYSVTRTDPSSLGCG